MGRWLDIGEGVGRWLEIGEGVGRWLDKIKGESKKTNEAGKYFSHTTWNMVQVSFDNRMR